MPRRPPAPIDTTRRLAHVSMDGSGATGKHWKGEIYVRGMEDQLPADFPEDGPWWEDWIPEPTPKTRNGLAAFLAREEAKALREQNRRDGIEEDEEEDDGAGLEHPDDLSHLQFAGMDTDAPEGAAGLIPSDEEDGTGAAVDQPLSGHPGSRRARSARGARARSEARGG